MALPRNESVAVGLASMGLVWAVYQQATPNISDLRVSAPNEPNAAGAEKAARWAAAAMVAGVALITRDPTVFIMGGLAVVTLSWMSRHANMSNPAEMGGYAPVAPMSVHTGDGANPGVMQNG